MRNRKALIVVDVQNDFIDGTLPVPFGAEVIAPINQLVSSYGYGTIVLTQDWHPPSHRSFARNNQVDGKALEPGDIVQMPYGKQRLWPVHCVQDNPGASFPDGLVTDSAHMILRKGMDPEVDSYSAFREADRSTGTGLMGYLIARGVIEMDICGLALDYCVAETAIDAKLMLGSWPVRVIQHACRGITRPSEFDALNRMREAGIELI